MFGTLKSSYLRQLYVYWDEKRGSRAMPARTDIDPVEMATFLPHIVLLDVESAPRRYRYRLVGTAVAEAFGEEITGLYQDATDMGALGTQATATLDRVVEAATPGYLIGDFTKVCGRRLKIERLSLPLSRDGQAVNMILNGCALLQLS